MKPLYLDYHSTTPCETQVIDAMLPYFGADFGNPHAKAHAAGRAAHRVYEAARADIGALIGADAESITLTSGATEANNLALFGVAAAASDRREIIISAIEHDSVENPARALAKRGFTVKFLPVTPQGYVRLEDANAAISNKTLLISIIAASHELGTAQPLAEIAALAKQHGALFHTDATQAAGKIPLDVAAIGADLLSFSAHKIYGPLGIGALYVRQKPPVALAPQIFGGGQQRLRAGTIPLALAVGFGTACRLVKNGIAEESARLAPLRDRLFSTLESRGTGVIRHSRSDLPGLLNIRFPNIAAEELMLDCVNDLCLSSGAACASAARKPSGVLKAIGLDDAAIAGSLRISLGHATTAADIDFAAEKLAAAVLRHRR